MRFVQEEENPFGLSVGDMMAALLLVFVLLLVATLIQLEESFSQERERAQTVQEITDEYESIQQQLYERLNNEFKTDLPRWQATLKPDLSIQFKSPDVLFETGRDDVRDKFKRILDSFFPRYMGILYSPEFRDHITEIRVEGHTSSEWSENVDPAKAYFLNMELSQDRTRSVLKYGLEHLSQKPLREWARKNLTANGLSSSRPQVDTAGQEDKTSSRRVEFRVRTDAEQRIQQILNSREAS